MKSFVEGLIVVLATAGLVGALGMAAIGCSAPPRRPSCNPIMAECNPADYPRMTLMLPPWPFPALLVPIGAAK